jgi:hypothetical protein
MGVDSVVVAQVRRDLTALRTCPRGKTQERRRHPMKWKTNDWQHRARCGHLFVRIDALDAEDGYAPGDPGYEPPNYEWFIEPDDEDKSYRRAFASGQSPTLDAAKREAKDACRRIVAAMVASLEESSI